MNPFLVVYVIGAILVGLLGRRRRIGFVGFLLVSLIVTPILALLILFITAPRADTHAAT